MGWWCRTGMVGRIAPCSPQRYNSWTLHLTEKVLRKYSVYH